MYLHADFHEDGFGQKTLVGAMIILRGSHTDVLRIGINTIMVYFSRERSDFDLGVCAVKFTSERAVL